MVETTGSIDMETGKSSDELRQRIRQEKEILSKTVDRLGDKIQNALAGPQYIIDHPFVSLGVVAGLGFLVAGLLKQRRTPGEKILEAVRDTVEDISHTLSGAARRGSAALRKSDRDRESYASLMKTAVGSMIMKTALDFLLMKGAQAFQERGRRNGSPRPTQSTNL